MRIVTLKLFDSATGRGVETKVELETLRAGMSMGNTIVSILKTMQDALDQNFEVKRTDDYQGPG